MGYVLTIDQGTTGTTVSLLNKDGFQVSKINKEFQQIFPQPGWVEHNANDIWNSVLYGIEKVLEKSQLTGADIDTIGITNQRETVVLWDKSTGQPLYNAIVWQCRRTTEFCKSLKKKGLEKTIKSKTGLVVDPYFSASKINWLLNNVKGLKAKLKNKQVACGTIDSWLLYKLTGGEAHKTDVSNASRTQLMNLKTLNWDIDLLKIFKVPFDILPQIVPSNSDFGKTKNIGIIPDGIAINALIGDQQSALFGQACFSPGEAKCTFGTGSFILMNTGEKLVRSHSGLLTTVGWQLKGGKKAVYALEGGAFICGAAVQWLRDNMHFVDHAAEIERLALSVDSTDGVELIPAFTGLGAPYWQPQARGLICGLTRGTQRGHIARATLEGMALQNVDILVAMEKDLKKKMPKLKVDGGASENNLLMQMQSDYLGVKLQRPAFIETTAAGAGYLAGLGAGIWKSMNEIKQIYKLDREFKSQIPPLKRKERLKSWHQAVKRSF
ncbi:MAG: glycerol kinase GlpK [Bdellovibrionales bacterium]|nr:glycerol kinase GlpK [Bdellovibrionales bacterium]